MEFELQHPNKIGKRPYSMNKKLMKIEIIE